MRPEQMLPVGSVVKHVLHRREHEGHLGIIVGREVYEDAQGSTAWYYVRWMRPEGSVDAEPRKHEAWELLLV